MSVGHDDKSKEVLIIQILWVKFAFWLISCISFLIWLHFVEAVFFTPYPSALEKMLFFTFLGVVILSSIQYWKVKPGKVGKIFYFSHLVLFFIILIFNIVTNKMYYYSGAKFSQFEIDRLLYEKDFDKMLSKYQVLYFNEATGIYIIGIKRGFLKRYKDRAFYSEKNGDNVLYAVYPTNFEAYLELLSSKNKIEYINSVEAKFFNLQYPDYIYMIIRRQANETSYYSSSETNTGVYTGIRRVRPVFSELFNGNIGARFKTYYNIFRFLFNSPHYRTDLVDDPYFLIWRGEIDKAREGLNKIPKERREFLVEHYGDVLGVTQ